MAMGGIMGIVALPYNNECTQLQYFKTAKNTMEGVMFGWNTAHVIIRNVVVSDSKNGITATASSIIH